jgi:coatomer subunit beta'
MDEGIMKLDVLERIFDGSHEPTGLKLSALQSITRNFSEERIIGTGGFGTVYKVNSTFQSFFWFK